MFKGLFSKFKKKVKDYTKKIKGFFKGGEAVEEQEIDVKIPTPPSIPKPEPNEPVKGTDAGILERDMTKAKQFYINMLSAYDDEDFPGDLLHRAKMAILFATDEQLDALMDMLGDNGYNDWKEHYEDLRLSRLTEDILADMEAKLEQIIQILS